MKLAIIGGGAAGLMAAAAAMESDPKASIFLIEKNDELGKKVTLSGGGRANVTTGLSELREILARYPRGGKFLALALRRFPPAAVRDWFETRGVPLKVEKDGRVFPRSNNGRDVVLVFEKLFRQPDSNVRLMLKRPVTAIKKTVSGFTVEFKNQEPLAADRVIITTGGQAHRATGSTGDGYALAEALGHKITALAPSLSSFVAKEKWPGALAGLSLEYARLFLPDKPKTFAEGPLLFTHRGISGPAVFAFSSLVAFEKFDPTRPLAVAIDLFPGEDAAALAKRLSEKFQRNGKKNAKTVLGFFISKTLAEIVYASTKSNPQIQAAQANKKDAADLVRALKALPLAVVGRGAGEEFVTAGGVDTNEINPRTMESRLCPGLFFAGEILNVDGFTGGFNLQAAWATGRAAGEHAVR